MSTGKRNVVWDIVKGLGILFVVAGQGFGGSISKYVNLFHIPLFFFVSWLVFSFYDRSFQSILRMFIKCVKTLWLLSVLYGSFYVLMHNLFVSYIWIRYEGLPATMLSNHPVVGNSWFWGFFYTAIGLSAPLLVPVIKQRAIMRGKMNNG